MPRGDQNKALRERDTDIVKRYMGGETLERIGRSLGLTRERIRQILWREVGQDAAQTAYKALGRARRANAIVRIPTGRCIVCWAPMADRYKGKGITCSKQCAADYRVVRYHIDDESWTSQRLRTADWILRHPEKVPASQLRYYSKIANGTAVKRRERYTCKGSKAQEVLARVLKAREGASGDWHIEFQQATQ